MPDTPAGTRQCPKGHMNPASQEHCGTCGRKLGNAEGVWAQSKQKAAADKTAKRAANQAAWEAMTPAQRKRWTWAMVGGAAAIVLAIVALSAADDSGTSGGPSTSKVKASKAADYSKYGEAGPFGAHDICKEFVKRRLKAPSTAKFGGFDDGEDITGAAGHYIVREHVDAENSFGAKLRSHFTCEVQSAGDKWQLVSLTGLDE